MRSGPRIAQVSGETPRSARRRARWIGPILALLVPFGAAPVLSDPVVFAPAGAGTAATGCWSPGGAPALFSWSDTPGIACRDGAGASGSAQDTPLVSTAPGPVPAVGNTPTPAQITFSGNAYVGIAVAF